ncbi:hypothetical protein [Streptomyces sp. NRRL B-3648]|uniref:hypothetical protein n=1 Tax=Streptomyces sp. NRRL B-3648 TaxID=1519493 RepID=UPI001F3878B8|nr:hypothetical protein [Streptomyces sp. NRRL B-3648]
MRVLSLRAFPEPGADDQLAPIEQTRIERRRQAGVSHAAALRRARAERAAREPCSSAVLLQPTRLRESA